MGEGKGEGYACNWFRSFPREAPRRSAAGAAGTHPSPQPSPIGRGRPAHPMKALLITLLLSQFAPQHVGTEPLDAEREARVQRLGKRYRCPVCQGLSIADSGSPSARAQMDKLRDLVREGRSDPEINDYFVSKY